MYPEVSGSSRGSCFRQYSGAMLGFSKDQTKMTNRNRKGVVGMLPNANFQCSVTLPSKFQRFGDTSWGDWWRIWNASTVWVMGRHIPNQTWNTSVATCRGHEQWLSNQQFGTCSGFFSHLPIQVHRRITLRWIFLDTRDATSAGTCRRLKPPNKVDEHPNQGLQGFEPQPSVCTFLLRVPINAAYLRFRDDEHIWLFTLPTLDFVTVCQRHEAMS